jgi:hypothetical protein
LADRVHDLFTYGIDLDEDELRAAGAVIVGTWRGAGGIGWWDDELITLAGWPDGTTPIDASDGHIRATARPTAIAPLAKGGVFAHRLFELASADWDEMLELSTGAWPAFESAYGATIEGFFRFEDVSEPDARVLLITRYPSMAAWEESRGVARSASEDVVEAGRRFMRRRELTRRSIVRVGTLV